MADIVVKGYFNKPQVKTSGRGPFVTFSLAERQKQKEGYEKVYYNVTQFDTDTPPDDGSFGTVKGYLKMRKYQKDGVEKVSYDVVAQSIELSPKQAAKAAGSNEEDDFAL